MQSLASHQQPRVHLDDVTCAWVENTSVLSHINLDIQGSKLLCVAGPVGCGKSTLIMSILREILPTSGTVNVVGSVSYASQEPWILSETIKNNIVFGEIYDEERYLQVIDACALNADISLMPAGDETEIGERGVTLSGGQRARFVWAIFIS